MSVEIARTDLIQTETLARIQRRESLRAILKDICVLVVNTGKDAKALATLQLAQALVDPDLSIAKGSVLQLPSTKNEPTAVRAEDVAHYKAETARHEYIEQNLPELQFLLVSLQTALHLQNEPLVLQLVVSIKEFLHGIVFVGKDINASINGQQHHKLERQYGVALPEFAYDKLRQELYDTYVYPKHGATRVVWEVGAVFINGKTRGISDWIETVVLPLDKELVDQYLNQAVADGKVLSSNTHLAAFEMICEHQERIQTIALVSKEMLQHGHTIAAFRQSPKPELLLAARRSINTNTPVYVQ